MKAGGHIAALAFCVCSAYAAPTGSPRLGLGIRDVQAQVETEQSSFIPGTNTIDVKPSPAAPKKPSRRQISDDVTTSEADDEAPKEELTGGMVGLGVLRQL